jgi:hypothetical protein
LICDGTNPAMHFRRFSKIVEIVALQRDSRFEAKASPFDSRPMGFG